MKNPNRALAAAALALVLAGVGYVLTPSVSAHGEAGEVRFARQLGLGYLQFYIMQDKQLVERQAEKQGLGKVTTTYSGMGTPTAISDALLSGNVDVIGVGLPSFLTLWDKTRGNMNVRGIVAMNRQPAYLNTRNPNIKSIRDFTDNDRIALPAPKVSVQAIMLQMAAAKEFGDAKFDSLDHLTVSMAHPDATAAMLGGPSEIVANWSSAPFQYRQMKNPNIRRILTSTDLFTEGLSFNVIASTAKFRNDNPKLYGAFLAALKESTDFINADKRRAAEIYLKVTKDKTPVEDIMEVLADPAIQYTTKVGGINAFVSFMAKVGTLKNPPADWKDMFFPEALAGS
jgi:NitT/TauT family transport system substrate-binding protein